MRRFGWYIGRDPSGGFRVDRGAFGRDGGPLKGVHVSRLPGAARGINVRVQWGIRS